MKKTSSIYKAFDIVIVPFPFTDSIEVKNRPAIVLSNDENFNQHDGHHILAMVTSARKSKWSTDVKISNLSSCGLLNPSIVRFKIFSIDNRLIKAKIGHMDKTDQKQLIKIWKEIFSNF